MLLRDDLFPQAAPAGLELPASFVWPRYGGASIANLPAALGGLLGADAGWDGPALDAELTASFGARPERVILLLVDGLGWLRLRRQLEQDDAGFTALLAAHGLAFAPLTSVAPSTTSVATTVLLGSGAAPAQLGLLGYAFLLPALGVIANMLFWHPAGEAKPRSGSLEGWGIAPEGFLPTPSLAQNLARGGASMRALLPAAYHASPLSRMQLRGASVEGYLASTDLWLKLEAWLAAEPAPALCYAYYPHFDALGHRDGVEAPFFADLWQDFTAQLARFLRRAAPRERGRTLLLLTADHGHVVTPLGARRTFQSVPGLLARALLPGGEPRHSYLYARGEEAGGLLELLERELGEGFAVLDGRSALGAGLYGDPARAHPEAARRLGDAVVLGRGPNHLWDERHRGAMLGMHGGLEPEEMLVPLVALRL